MQFSPYHQPVDVITKPAYRRLAYEHFSRVSWRQVIVIIVITLGVIFALNTAVYFYLETSRLNVGNFIFREKWRMLQTIPEPVDWLILGDSSANQGFDPAQLEAETGITALNLATNGFWGSVNDAWMLQTYIERFGAPEAVIIINAYDTFRRELEPNILLQAPFGFGFWHAFQPQLELSLAEQVEYALNRYFPLYYQDETIKAALIQLVRGGSEQPWDLTNAGFMNAYESDPDRVQTDYNGHIETLRQRVFEVAPSNQAAVTEMIRLAEEYGFTIYFKSSPIYEQLYNASEFQTYYDDLSAWLRELDASSSAVVFLDEPSLFPSSMLQNADHLTAEGAEIFTSQVIDLVLGARDSER